LVVAIDPKGLTSKYLQSKPLHLRILPTVSEFYVPTGRPIFMIANGTGIAPFRSLAQHFMSGGAERPEIRL
jgi:NAD(P)H-flavin reductase